MVWNIAMLTNIPPTHESWFATLRVRERKKLTRMSTKRGMNE
jgi:hypothetical protein